jgi:DNA-binding NarL/FixJ family response regulator
LLAENAAGVGYLLKDRVADTADFVEALTRVAAGGTALDPEVVSQLLAGGHRAQNLDATLTRREGEVLALMADGRSNAAIAARLVVSPGAVEKHVANVFAKLGLLSRATTTAASWPYSVTPPRDAPTPPCLPADLPLGPGGAIGTTR